MKKYFQKLKQGFSLIELSIVLVIMSLLTASIVGSTSLIRSAKINSIITQWHDWEVSVHTFRIIKNQLPGDINDNGKIGYIQNELAYNATGDVCNVCGHYTGDYADKNVGTVAGPWVDLYLAKLSTFKPDPDSSALSTVYYPTKSQIGVILPESKMGKDVAVYFNYETNLYIKNRNVNSDFKAQLLYEIDKKLDNGLWNSGSIKSVCDINETDKTYDTFIKEKTNCSALNYLLREFN